MSSNYSLELLDALSLDKAASLHAAAFAPLGERAWNRRDLAELIALPGVRGFLLLNSERAVGFALCRTAADEAELLTIAVDPAHRRDGAGRRLLEAVIDEVRRHGAMKIYLEVAVDNAAAIQLYRATGFGEVGRRQDYYGRGRAAAADALIMSLKLGG